MELLNEMKIMGKYNKVPKNIFQESVLKFDLCENQLAEVDEQEREIVLSKIKNNDFIKNDYNSFLQSLFSGKRSSFLTPYTAEDFQKDKVATFQVNGYNIGFALKPIGKDIDIISVHNNSGVPNIGEALIEKAKEFGGTTLDHFDGFLSDFYQNLGFDEYERYKWNDDYAPTDWDYEKYGKPDVVMRRLKKIK